MEAPDEDEEFCEPLGEQAAMAVAAAVSAMEVVQNRIPLWPGEVKGVMEGPPSNELPQTLMVDLNDRQ
ncbi:hypothetical protein GCM10029978_040830 [Actinoallomurus acanthiterrae]